MTYGWALLVIVVVGAALFALGVLNPSTYTQSGCRGFAFFNYQDQRMAQTSYTIQVLNGAQDVNVTSIAVTNSGALTFSPTVLVSRGQKVTIVGSGTTLGKSVGSSFTEDVTITYNVVGGIQGQTDRAVCTGKVQ